MGFNRDAVRRQGLQDPCVVRRSRGVKSDPSPYMRLYLSAIDNEFYMDEFVLKKYFPDAFRRLGRVILRPTLFYTYLHSRTWTWLLGLAFQVIVVIWWPLYYGISLWHLGRVVLSKLRYLANEVRLGTAVVLSLSPRATVVIPPVLKEDLTTTQVGWPRHNVALPIPRYLTWAHLVQAFLLTLAVPFNLDARPSETRMKKAFKLQTYDAYYVFATMLFLEAIDGVPEWIYFCNHYDRWAVLISACLRKSQACQVQHGFLAQDIAPPTKLANVDLLYVFDERSRDIFLGRIIRNCKEVRYVRATIDLSPLARGGFERSVLIIAQPIALSMEQGIVRQFASRYPRWLILVKPHPLYSSTAYQSLEVFPNVKIIRERNFYPAVDLAITCNSTLGLEYQSAGQRVYFFDGKSLNEIVSDLHATFEPLREAE